MNRREEFYITNHALCILDFLGQRNRLAEWANLDMDNPHVPQPCIKKTAGTVLAFQELVDTFLAEFEKPSRVEGAVQSLSPEKQDVLTRCKDCRLGTQQFSDTFVFYAPTTNSRGDVSAGAIYRILTACCMTMLVSLAAKAPVRGSICVGLGVELDEHNFYGPVLAEAYHIESELAQWPRVLVSKSAARFINFLTNKEGNDDLTKIMRLLGNICASMICQDCDGQLMVDFLGKGIQDICNGKPSELTSTVKMSYEFVRSEADRFRKDKNAKLALRYHLLQQYIESRLPLWGLKQQ